MRPFNSLLLLAACNLFYFCGNSDAAKTGLPDAVSSTSEIDTTVKPTGLIAYTRNDAERSYLDNKSIGIIS